MKQNKLVLLLNCDHIELAAVVEWGYFYSLEAVVLDWALLQLTVLLDWNLIELAAVVNCYVISKLADVFGHNQNLLHDFQK